ncbi:MAG: hypothetical protein HY286_05840 [Planctomycetes bacterium]|nr:hypothetical protein [Planctomycetota bacterium]
MTNCVRCGSEIPIKDILNGSYRKVDGNPFHSQCAPATAASGAGASSTPEPVAAAASSSAKPKSATPVATAASKSGIHSAPKSSSSGRSASSSSISGVRSKSGITSSRGARTDEGAEGEEEERPRGYVKKEDKLTKYLGIGAIAFFLVVGTVTVIVVTNKNKEDAERTLAWSNSQGAIAYIRQQFTDNTDDGAIDNLESIIKQKEPDVLPIHRGELDSFKQELIRRRDTAKQRKDFNTLFEFLKQNSKDPKKAEDVQKALIKADALMGLATDAQRKDMATFKILNNVSILEAHYEKAVEVELNPANKENYPLITAAFQEAEEWFTGEAQSLIKAKLEGSERAKELFELIQNKTNQYADFWANSEKYGFKTVPALNVLEGKEFQKIGANEPHWSNSKLSTWKLDGTRMIATGIGGGVGAGEMRAGVLFWGPNGSSVRTMTNGKDILPGTRETMRHYELTMKFKVVKKGFTLLARHTGGYQRHAYGFETTAAQEETKNANNKAKAAGKLGDPASPAKDPFANTSPADDRSTNYAVDEGKSYEVVEQVYGNKIRLMPKEEGTADSDPLEDNVRARYGGIGIQLLPGAEIIFEQLSIRILM